MSYDYFHYSLSRNDSLSGINFVNRSVIGLLDLAGADGGSEESLITVTVLAVDSAEVRDGGGGQLVVVGLLVLLGGELVDDMLVLDLSVRIESVQGRLSDGDDLLEDVPEDALSESGSGEAALVGPSSISVQLFDECRHVELLSTALVVGDEGSKELVVVVGVGVEVLVRDYFENEAEDTVGELRSLSAGHRVDDVHLHIVDYAINGVLSGSMEVSLHTLQVDVLALEVSVEEAGRLGGHAAVGLHQIAELVVLLREDLVVSRDGTIVGGELVIDEVGVDGDVAQKVDGRLSLTNADLGTLEVEEGLAGSRGVGGYGRLGEISLVVLLAVVLAVGAIGYFR